MALELEDSVATLKHINARKEGAEDDKELAVDIKLEIDELAVNICPQFAPDLRGMLFDGDRVRFPAMGEIEWSGEHMNMELEICGFTFSDARLSKFKIRPFIDARGVDTEDYTDFQRVELTLQASFKPQSTEIASMAELLGESTKISIRARQKELPI